MRKVLSSLGFLAVYGAALFLTFTALSRFVAVQGAFMFVVTGLCAIVILIVVFGGFMAILRFSGRNDMRDMHERLTDTLREIANGNFNVFVEADPHAPHNEIAEAINEMARNLGSLETMRQDFISNVSHEIQSPLTSIGGFAALLRAGDLTEEQRRYADIIAAESKRLSSLSENLLKLSSLDNNKIPLARHPFRLDKQLKAVALTLEPQWAAKNLAVEADLAKCTLTGDEDLLSQIWINLLHNAVKFTPEGGRIALTAAVEGGLARVRVSDTGVGIAAEELPHIFERFYKVDKARDRSLGGNGLGLSLVKKIVELHGGHVTVDSAPGRETAFEVALPLQ